MTKQFQPIPGDPDGSIIDDLFDANSKDWILSAPGDYQTAAAQTWQKDGSNFQNVVILEWPGRKNHSDEHVTVRLMMSPEDAIGLANVLRHTGKWLGG